MPPKEICCHTVIYLMFCYKVSFLFVEKMRYILIFPLFNLFFSGYASFWHLATFTLRQN